jgi:peptidyl-prolyl cis-trans isomerase D
MRRLLLMMVALSALGCREAFVAHQDSVARADATELTVTRLAELLASARQIPLDRGVIDALARSWIEFTLFAHRTAGGDALLDSAMVVNAMWPNVHNAVVDSFYNIRIASQVTIDPAAVDSAYRAGNLRYVAHILRRLTSETTPEEKEMQRAEAQRIFEFLDNGGSWEDANAFNQDSVAQARGGLLPPLIRGTTVPRFENAAFGLGPGQISPVVETNFGFHIIFRPELGDVIQDYGEVVRGALIARVDSAYERQLLEGKLVEVRPDAPAYVRQAAVDPFRARQLDRVVATYDGGEFTVGGVVRWLKMLDVQTLQQLPNAPDDQVVQFTQSLLGRELLYQQADSAGIGLTPELFATVLQEYESQLVALRRAMRVHPDSLGGPTADLTERELIADLLVDGYLEAALRSQVEFVSVPPFLAEQLLDQGDWAIESAGILRALERAAQMRAALQANDTPGQ